MKTPQKKAKQDNTALPNNPQNNAKDVETKALDATTSQTQNLWTNKSPKSIELRCNTLPFYAKTSVNWRGQIIHIRIKAEKTEYGWVRLITFRYNNKLYPCGLLKWNWPGSGSGSPPEISTSNYKLEIVVLVNNVVLKDVLIKPYERDGKIEHPFEIFTTPENIVFDKRKRSISLGPDKPIIEKNQVTLYEYRNRVVINSYAYFEAEKLIVDYWKLSNSYEDEYFVTVDKNNVEFLFKEFKIYDANKAELLIAISNAFRGEDCFEKFKKYLKQNKIPFENSVRR
jgi:hypothetical protein